MTTDRGPDGAEGKRVVAAMSGGVDSAVAAALLVEAGWEVIGVTMLLLPPGEPFAARSCCSLEAAEEARQMAAGLGITHYVLDLRDAFREAVIEPFCREYHVGRTPNPCILCNRHVKFEALWERAQALRASYIATGHYVRVEFDEAASRWTLQRAVDRDKDQSYVLYTLTQEQLARTLMPMGGLTKAQARRKAATLGLRAARRPESQDICFVSNDDYRGYLRRMLGGMMQPGPIIHVDGRTLGEHEGLAHYTIGQRKRLGLAIGRPLYVVGLDVRRNAVIVGQSADLLAARVLVGGVNMVSLSDLEGEVRLSGQLRYRMQAAPCRIQKTDEKLAAVFDTPQRAITPGQAAVFYAGDRVACGGTIEAADRAG